MPPPISNGVGHEKLKEFTVEDVISKGSFGVVYRAVRRSDGRVFALKQVSLNSMKKVERQEAIDEARMLAQMNHPHIIKHYDSFIDSDNKLNILMEYASKGNVAILIKAQRGKPMPEDAVWRIFIQSLLGLHYIHSKKIIHRDIKALNLFVDSSDNIKIGDLGIARALSNNSDFARTIVGTPYYLSPELCEDKPYDVKSDVWALGVVLYECCMGKYPFDAQNEGALIRKIIRGQFPPLQGPYTNPLIQLVTSCLSFKPVQRPDTASLLRHASLVAKAKALRIDLNPQPTAGNEDVIYDRAVPNPPDMVAAARQIPSGAPQQPPPMYNKLYGGAPAAGPYGNQHPFALPGAQPPVPQNAYGGTPYGQYGAQQGYGYQPSGQTPRGAPSPQPGGGHAAWDAVANDLQNKLQMGPNKGRGADPGGNREYPGQRDNLRNLLQDPSAPADPFGDPAARLFHQPLTSTGRGPPRADPQQLPAAGYRPGSAAAAAARSPFALDYGGAAPNSRNATNEETSVWNATYQPPQYGRRRCPELQITGPSLRGVGGGGGTRGGGGYVPAADDATSYVSSTNVTSHYR